MKNEIKFAHDADYALRDIAMFLSVGGYNIDVFDPKEFVWRIREGIIAFAKDEYERGYDEGYDAASYE